MVNVKLFNFDFIIIYYFLVDEIKIFEVIVLKPDTNIIKV